MKDKTKKQLTEEKELQRKAATQSIELYRKYSFLIDEARPVNISIDMDRRIIDVNELALKSLGFEKKELLGKNITELIVPQEREKAAQGFDLDLQGIGNPTVEINFMGRKGIRTFLFAQDAVALFENNQQVGVSIDAFDITELKKTEEQTQILNKKYQELFEHMMDGLVLHRLIVDEKGKPVDYILEKMNKAAENILSGDRKDIEGKRATEVYNGDTPFIKRYAKVAQTGKPEHFIDYHPGFDRWYEITSFCPEKGYFANIFRDITEQKKAAEKLQQAIQGHQLLMNTSPAGIWYEVYEKPIDITLPELEIARLMYETGIITEANNALAKMYGFDNVSQLKGKHWSEIISPQEGIDVHLQYIRAGYTAYGVITRETNNKGNLLYIENSLAANIENNKLISYFGMARNITKRKKAEEALRESERRYRTLFESKLDGIFVLDAETMRVVLANQSAAEMCGFNSAKEAVGVNPLDYVAPEERERTFRIIAEDMFERNLQQVNEFRMFTKDGEEKWISAVGTSIKYEGKLAGLVSFTDITKRKKAERELQQSIQGHQLLMDTSLAGIWYEVYEKPIDITLPEMEIARLMYETGTITEANDALAKMYGLDNASQLKGKRWPEIIPAQEELDVYLQYIRAGYNAYGLITHETDMEGNSIYIENSLAANIENNKLISYFGTARDITEHMQAQEQLRESEEKYRVLTQSALDGIIVAAEDGKILLWNPGAQRIFGYTAEEAVGQEITHLIVPQKYRKKVAQRWGNFFERGTTSLINHTQEFAGLRKNGMEFPAEISFGFMEIQGKKQSVAITRDITERKKAQQQLESAFIDLASTVSYAMETRDPYTSNHQRRVAELARLIGKKMNLDKQRLKGLYIAGLLHDIGKISTPEVILSKPGKLSPEEWQLVRAHTREGHNILKNTDFPWPIADMALHHHERLDGSGYPNGLSGDKLTLEMRILGLCDVVEAMSSHRPYRPARKKQEVIEEIKNGRGTKYDASVVDIMLGIIESGEFDFSNEPETSAATNSPLTLKR